MKSQVCPPEHKGCGKRFYLPAFHAPKRDRFGARVLFKTCRFCRMKKIAFHSVGLSVPT